MHTQACYTAQDTVMQWRKIETNTPPGVLAVLSIEALGLWASLHRVADDCAFISAPLAEYQRRHGVDAVAAFAAIMRRSGALGTVTKRTEQCLPRWFAELVAVGGLRIGAEDDGGAEGAWLCSLTTGKPLAWDAAKAASTPRRSEGVPQPPSLSGVPDVHLAIASARNDSLPLSKKEREEKKEEAGGGRARAHAHTYARAGASTDEPPSPAERPSVIGSTKSAKTHRVDAVARCAGAAWIDSPPSAARDVLESALAASLGDAAECELFGRYLASRDFAQLVALRFKCSLPASVDWFVFRSRETRALECGQRFESVVRAYRLKRTELVEGLERETKVRAAVDAYAAEHPSLVAVWESSREAIERDARRYHAEQSEQRPQFARCLGYVDAYAARMVEAARPLSPGEYENGLRSNGRDYAIERETKRRETIAKARGEQTQPATTTPAAARPEEMSLSARWAALASSPRRDPSESAARFAATVAADKARHAANASRAWDERPRAAKVDPISSDSSDTETQPAPLALVPPRRVQT